jgi:hypothetical protein
MEGHSPLVAEKGPQEIICFSLAGKVLQQAFHWALAGIEDHVVNQVEQARIR